MRHPVAVFHVSEYIQEELDARGWTMRDLAERLLGNVEENLLMLMLLFCVHEKGLLLGESTARQLGQAFGGSPQFFLNLDQYWQDNQ